jgi:hypothetical protein
VSRVAGEAIEALIALFKTCEIWSEYRAAAEVPNCPDSAESILRERWMQEAWQRTALGSGRVDELSWRLAVIECKFLSEIFTEMVRSGKVIVEHRFLTRHHPTSDHYSTLPEMFDNAGIAVDRGEILMQLNRGPRLKLVEIKHNVSAARIGVSGQIASASVSAAESDKTIVENYVAAEREAGGEPTQRGCVRKTKLTRSRVRKAWPPDVPLKPGRRYSVTSGVYSEPAC